MGAQPWKCTHRAQCLLISSVGLALDLGAIGLALGSDVLASFLCNTDAILDSAQQYLVLFSF